MKKYISVEAAEDLFSQGYKIFIEASSVLELDYKIIEEYGYPKMLSNDMKYYVIIDRNDIN